MPRESRVALRQVTLGNRCSSEGCPRQDSNLRTRLRRPVASLIKGITSTRGGHCGRHQSRYRLGSTQVRPTNRSTCAARPWCVTSGTLPHQRRWPGRTDRPVNTGDPTPTSTPPTCDNATTRTPPVAARSMIRWHLASRLMLSPGAVMLPGRGRVSGISRGISHRDPRGLARRQPVEFGHWQTYTVGDPLSAMHEDRPRPAERRKRGRSRYVNEISHSRQRWWACSRPGTSKPSPA